MNFFQKCLYLSILIVLAFSCKNKNENKTVETGNPVNSSSVIPGQGVFDYQPEKPENGELAAAIEIGSLGLNYFIVNIDAQGRWDLVDSSFGRSNIVNNTNDNGEIASDIVEYISEIRSKGVDRSNIHILASSSAIRIEDISALNEAIKSTGYTIKSISPAEEAKYALIATVPKEFADESFIVDIGSGNSKLSWIEGNDTLSIEIHGSKYFLSGVQDTTVFREVRNALLEIPPKNRNLCFMLGGMIYEFLKEEVESSTDRYFILKAPGVYPTNNQKLKAGNVIYSALYLEPTYSYIFDSQSNFTIGYLKSIRIK